MDHLSALGSRSLHPHPVRLARWPNTSDQELTLIPSLGGSVTINSSNPFDPPRIDPNLLASEFDIFTYRESVRASQRFFAAPAWKDYIIGPFQPPANAISDEDIDAYLRSSSIASSHACGTCAMSAKDAGYGVVNPDLHVKGVKGLRVVDASIMVRSGSPFARIY